MRGKGRMLGRGEVRAQDRRKQGRELFKLSKRGRKERKRQDKRREDRRNGIRIGMKRSEEERRGEIKKRREERNNELMDKKKQ